MCRERGSKGAGGNKYDATGVQCMAARVHKHPPTQAQHLPGPTLTCAYEAQHQAARPALEAQAANVLPASWTERQR
jgi:hypothetical protein